MTAFSSGPTVQRYPDAQTLAREAAQWFVQRAQEAVRERGRFVVALSGGTTPRAMFEQLASSAFAGAVDWSRTQVFFSDERFVPPESPESNFHMARETLLSKVAIPERFVHVVPTVGVTPEESATLYEQGIRRVMETGDGEVPSMDLILLGLGPDGHTASLFPNSDALTIEDQLVAPNWVETADMWRITFTYPLINGARDVAFLTEGTQKAERVAQVLAGDMSLPASRVAPLHGRLTWLVDEAAAGRVQGGA